MLVKYRTINIHSEVVGLDNTGVLGRSAKVTGSWDCIGETQGRDIHGLDVRAGLHRLNVGAELQEVDEGAGFTMAKLVQNVLCKLIATVVMKSYQEPTE